MLPWDSQYRNVVSREGHAWILADLARDPQVAAVAELAEGLSGAMHGGRTDHSHPRSRFFKSRDHGNLCDRKFVGVFVSLI